MAGLRPHLEHGPETHFANEDIVGGTLVEAVDASTTKKVRKASAGSTTVLGLAIGDAAAIPGAVAPVLDAWGRNTAGQLTPPNEVAVAYRGSWWLKNTTAAVLGYGTRLVCGANGTIAAAGVTPDARTIVGIVIEPGGITVGAEGRVRLTIR